MARNGIPLDTLTRKLEPIFAARIPVTVGVTSAGGVYTILQGGPKPKEERGRLNGVTRPDEVLEAVRTILPSGYIPLDVETTDNGTTYQSFVPSSPD